MATGIDAQILAEDETTFQFQDTLESLPLPSLDNTLKRYLDSGKMLRNKVLVEQQILNHYHCHLLTTH